MAPQDSMPPSTGTTPVPLAYARPSVCGPIAGVFRSGKYLNMPCGADLSAYCIHCGAPASGKPRVLRYHPRSNVGTELAEATPEEPIGCAIYIVLLALSAFMAIRESRDAARRLKVTVTVGLCDLHRRRRRRILWAAGIVLLLSVGLFVAGLWVWIAARYRTHDDTTVAQSAMIAGAIFAFLGPLLILTRLQRARIATAGNGRAMIAGAGRPFLDAQATVDS